MGGRGSSFGVEVISALGIKGQSGEAVSLPVAGMTPTDRGSRFTNAQKTLKHIEGMKREYDKEQLQVLDRYGYVTRAFQGDEHSVAVDLNTREYMRGKIVTHNHPSSYGGTFSDADINCLAMGMKELRASAKEGNYSMKATREADPVSFYKSYQEAAPKLQAKMKDIAVKMAKGKWKDYEEYQKENRKAQLQVLHGWYMERAQKFGYEYKFESNNDER